MIKINLLKQKINKNNLSVLCRQISFMLNSGIPISKSIQILSLQSENKILQSILKDIHKNLLEGKSFSQCLAKHYQFPALMINMIKVGEISGSLNEIMEKLADYYEEEYKFISNLKSAMIYPVIVCIMMIVVLFLALAFVIPGYAQIFLGSGAELPMITQIVIAVSNFLSRYFLWMILFFTIALCFTKHFLKTDKGRILYGKILFSYPIKKIYLPRLNFIFAQICAMLLESGINIILVIENVKEIVSNKFLDKDFDEMINKMKNGSSINKTVAESKKFSPILSEMINVGESTGNLSDIMLHCQKYFQNEFTNNFERLQKLIEPTLIIFIGLILGIIMIAIMEPTFTISDIL